MRKRNAGKFPCGRRTASGIAFTGHLLESLPYAYAVGRKNRRRFGNCGGKIFPLHKAEPGNQLCAFIHHNPEKPAARIAYNRREPGGVGKCRRARQTVNDRFLRKLGMFRFDSKRKPLRKCKRTAYPRKRAGACPHDNAVQSGES